MCNIIVTVDNAGGRHFYALSEWISHHSKWNDWKQMPLPPWVDVTIAFDPFFSAAKQNGGV